MMLLMLLVMLRAKVIASSERKPHATHGEILFTYGSPGWMFTFPDEDPGVAHTLEASRIYGHSLASSRSPVSIANAVVVGLLIYRVVLFITRMPRIILWSKDECDTALLSWKVFKPSKCFSVKRHSLAKSFPSSR